MRTWSASVHNFGDLKASGQEIQLEPAIYKGSGWEFGCGMDDAQEDHPRLFAPALAREDREVIVDQ